MPRPTDRSLLWTAIETGRRWRAAQRTHDAATADANEIAHLDDPAVIERQLKVARAAQAGKQAMADQLAGDGDLADSAERDLAAAAAEVDRLEKRLAESREAWGPASRKATAAAAAVHDARRAFEVALDAHLRRRWQNFVEAEELAALSHDLGKSGSAYGRELTAAIKAARGQHRVDDAEEAAVVRRNARAATEGLPPMNLVGRP